MKLRDLFDDLDPEASVQSFCLYYMIAVAKAYRRKKQIYAKSMNDEIKRIHKQLARGSVPYFGHITTQLVAAAHKTFRFGYFSCCSVPSPILNQTQRSFIQELGLAEEDAFFVALN